MKEKEHVNGFRDVGVIPSLDIPTLDRYIQNSGVKELTRDLEELRSRASRAKTGMDISPPQQ